MQEIKMWVVGKNDSDKPAASPVRPVSGAKTEEHLEDMLVNTPDLLMDGLSLIGRQVETQGGPLDLLGIDQDGRVVVFELKKGTLTRDAVAQIIDYASDIAVMTGDQFAKLIEENSGKPGIAEIEEFQQWFDEHYPDENGVDPSTVRMVLVGLGADARARRMVDFMAASGVQIELLTFHVFEQENQQFIARQSETRTANGGSELSRKERNLLVLEEEAKKLNVVALIREVSEFLKNALPAYQWIGTTSYSYHLTETSDTGRPTQRAYFALRLNYKKPGFLSFVIYKRAIEATGLQKPELMVDFSKDAWHANQYDEIELEIGLKNWDGLKPAVKNLMEGVIQGWRRKSSTVEISSEE